LIESVRELTKCIRNVDFSA